MVHSQCVVAVTLGAERHDDRLVATIGLHLNV